jgi:hypothetical protein
MQSIIGNIEYNTATAFEVARFNDGRTRTDPLHRGEVLYRANGA